LGNYCCASNGVTGSQPKPKKAQSWSCMCADTVTLYKAANSVKTAENRFPKTIGKKK